MCADAAQVAALLKELGLTYESKYVDFANKPTEFLKVAPNGRIPALVDHKRNDKVVWESVAVLLYLQHHYDKENKFWFTDEDEIADAHQWLLFQASGIGPYFGQKVTHTRPTTSARSDPLAGSFSNVAHSWCRVP